MFLSRLAVLSVLALAPSLMFAVPVTGTVDIAAIGNAVVTPTSLDFLCGNGGCPALITGTMGDFTVTNGTGSFTGLGAPAGTDGYIGDLNAVQTPLGVAFGPLQNWIQFVADPDIRLDLTFISRGSNGQPQPGSPLFDCQTVPAAGQICTPNIPGLGISAYNLNNVAVNNPDGSVTLNSSASFSVAGFARRVSTGELSSFTGVFTAQFTTDYQTVLTQLRDLGSVTNSYSATFRATFTPVPEPGAMYLTLGGGLILLAAGWRKKMAAKRS